MKLNPCRKCGKKLEIKKGRNRRLLFNQVHFWWLCTNCLYKQKSVSNSEENAIKNANKCNPLEAQDEIDSVS